MLNDSLVWEIACQNELSLTYYHLENDSQFHSVELWRVSI